jgi:hypothetical protein
MQKKKGQNIYGLNKLAISAIPIADFIAEFLTYCKSAINYCRILKIGNADWEKHVQLFGFWKKSNSEL